MGVFVGILLVGILFEMFLLCTFFLARNGGLDSCGVEREVTAVVRTPRRRSIFNFIGVRGEKDL